MTTIASGPMFEPPKHNGFEKVNSSGGGSHYSVWHLDSNNGRADPVIGMESLRTLFPEGEADEYNFVLFSTSGVHGSYLTIEEIEASLQKYGEDFEPDGDEPDDWCGTDLTVLVVHPRTVCLRCGNVRVRLSDVPYLKKLRASSLKAVTEIGVGS